MSQKKTYAQIASKVRYILDTTTEVSEKDIIEQLPNNERTIYEAGPQGIPEKRTENRTSSDAYKDIDDKAFIGYHRLRSADSKERFLELVEETVKQFSAFKKNNNSKTYENYKETLPYPSQKTIAKYVRPSVEARLGISQPAVTASKPAVTSVSAATSVKPTVTSVKPKTGYVTVPKNIPQTKPESKGFFSSFLSMLPGAGTKKEDPENENEETPTVAATVARPVTRPASRLVYQAPATLVPIQGYCPINNPNNWCYLNSSIQMLNDIPELKAGFSTLTPAQIAALEINLLSHYPRDRIVQGLTLLQSLFAVLAASDFKTAIDFKTKTVPNGISIYKEYIDFLLFEKEKRLKEDEKPFFTSDAYYAKQSDADESVSRTLDAIFLANLDFLLKLKYMFTYQEVSVFNCENTAIGNQGYIETLTGSPFSTSMELTLHKFDDFGNPTAWVSSLQQAVNNQEALEPLTEGNNMLDYCGMGGQKGKALSKGFKFIIFPFTKYLFIKVKRLEEGLYYKGNIEVNKTLTIDGVEFQPRGVIHHSGRLIPGRGTSGHYTYYHFENGVPAILCNDASISRITNVALAWDAINTGARAVLYERKTPIDQAKLNAAVEVEKTLYAPVKPLFELVSRKVMNAKRLRNINEPKVDKKISKIASINVLKGIQGATQNTTIRNYTRKQLNFLQKDKARGIMMAKLDKELKEGIHAIRTQAVAQVQPQGAVQENNEDEDEDFEAFMLGDQTAAATATTATTSSNNNSNANSTIHLEPLEGGRRKRKTRKNKNKKH